MATSEYECIWCNMIAFYYVQLSSLVIQYHHGMNILKEN